MIKKLTEISYLKRFDNMTKQEQDELITRAKAWYGNSSSGLLFIASRPAAAFQNLLQLSMTLNDKASAEIEEGISILSAFAHTEESWLPEIVYVKAAKRSIKWICQSIRRIASAPQAPAQAPASEPVKPAAEKKEKPAAAPKKPAPVKTANVSAAPVRPKHIDQYVHLLPAETQKRAQAVRGLLRDLDEAREKARMLSNDAASSHADIARWAKKATKIDDEIRAIYKELDAEWDKLVASGKITVDDLGNARVTETAPEQKPEPKKPAAKKPAAKKAETKKAETKKPAAKKPAAKKPAAKKKS